MTRVEQHIGVAMATFDPKSGTWRCQKVSVFDAEGWAHKIRALARDDEREPMTVGVLALHLYGTDVTFRWADGVPVGGYAIEFGRTIRNGDCDEPISVSLARNQRPQDRTIAICRACARYGAWAFVKPWDACELEAIALAIAIPRDAARSQMSCAELARRYCLDLEIVMQRLRLLGALVRESGERPAVAG